MLSVAEIEDAALISWPALDSLSDGHWVARYTRGFSGRANSIWCLDPADDDNAAQRIARLAATYAEHDLPPLFRVTPLTGRNTLVALEAGAWEKTETSLVLSTPIGETAGFDAAARLFDATDPAFFAAQAGLQGFAGATLETFTAIVAAIRSPACGIVLFADDGAPAASLLCVQTDGIVMFYDVVTAASRRGEGFGRRMMASGLSWGAENGAAHAALQVQGTNSPAIGLYLAMGFTFRYPYHYRRPAEVRP